MPRTTTKKEGEISLYGIIFKYRNGYLFESSRLIPFEREADISGLSLSHPEMNVLGPQPRAIKQPIIF